MSIEFDFSEVGHLAANLDRVPGRAAPNVRKAVEVTARKVKDDARDNTKGMKQLRGIPPAIDYDMRAERDSIGADIGFRRDVAQGALGNFIEYGSKYFPARGPLAHALHENEEDFVRGLGIAIADAIEDAL
ncbi:hypothetical protein GCM10011490_24210 [Pseudoclavibacter endophyticus]|uniref:HK97 gp10 family phage protein n=1 Tax=Pseudoclavibacter endophyticus TaxID=1778590 RepID=A0A6H9WCK2_9MICO|nr:hypothetical protein [Pseudoclavibacter endophyticus]KAB1648423.1 hypothetical protein F8O04_12115 [Pseudoclavibacter endophyticus]GGA72589.1 hypothetical protein GCM10011490_24210 [Pseudoclavibacter endophyticus]